jgi:peptidoglycan/LPS O-acetylase OafA/YrhL
MQPRPTDKGLEYQPALDGVRAVAVVMVLLFHAGLSWMGGGYLGVSVFFTLSGFLITSLLLAEADRTGGVSFRRFYSRRMKRLMPASLVCLLVVVGAYWFGGEFRLVPGMRGQLWGALAQVYNWVRIAGSSSYQDLFRQAPSLLSPLEHYWSLAIEEQFYVVWPLVVWAVVARQRPGREGHGRKDRGRSALLAFVSLTIVCAAAAPIISALTTPKVAYWSTPTRLGELLVGASAAAWHQRGGRLPAWGRWLGVAALAVLVALAMELPVGSGPAYTGWMTPIAVVSTLLILSLQVPGPVRSVLALAPLVWIGKLSYGVYLYHWPVFVLLRAHGWQLGRPLGFLLALSITMALAAVSFIVVERPARRAVWPAPRTFAAAAAAVALVAAVITVSPTHRGFLETDQQVFDDAAIETVESLAPLQTASTTASSLVDTTSTIEPTVLALPELPNRPIRVLTIGDSTALIVGEGLASWAVDHPGYVQLDLR